MYSLRSFGPVLASCVALLTAIACQELPSDAPGDGRDDSFLTGGKVDAYGIEEGTPTAEAVLLVANAAPLEVLQQQAGLEVRAATGIVAHRNGPDGELDTADDDRFESLGELDAVEWVGPVAFQRLIAFATAQGLLEPSIIGGQEEEGYPSAGYLERNGRLLCTMVLVAPDKVLTAAHCVSEEATYSIGFGKYSIFNEVWPVESVYIHPQYTPVTYRHDLAVLTLRRPVEGVEPAVIDEIGPSGCGYRGVGYGRSDEGLKTDPFTSWEWAIRKSLQHCIVRQADERVYVDGVDGAICWGDSGGPLYQDGSNRVVGVLSGSLSRRCELEKVDLYTVLAREASFVNAALSGGCRNDGPAHTPATCSATATTPPASDAWISTPCTATAACDFEYAGQPAFCLTQAGQDLGFCTVGCAGYCPDKAGKAGTFCAALGGTGLCVSKAAPENQDCVAIEGSQATQVERFVGASGAPAAVAVACVPVVAAPPTP